jgi:hypothetical protein
MENKMVDAENSRPYHCSQVGQAFRRLTTPSSIVEWSPAAQ